MGNKNNLRELTPQYMRCAWGSCPAIYEVTPKDMQCIGGACPSIYEEGTPKKMQCAIGGCPQIIEEKHSYLIIGKQIDPSKVGLEGKVGQGEVLIKVPKDIIDKKEK